MPSNFSKLNLALRSGFRRPISVLQGGFKNSVGALLGQGKKLFGDHGLCVSEHFSTLSEVQLLLRPTTELPATVDSQKESLSFIGALTRTFSVPSVSGPPFHVIDHLLLDSPHESPFQKLPMVSCDSGVGSSNNFCVDNLSLKDVDKSVCKSGLAFGHKSIDCCKIASAALLSRGSSGNGLINNYLLCESAKISCGSSTFGMAQSIHSLASASYSAGPATDISFDGSTLEESLPSSSASPQLKIVGDRSLKLLSGSCYLPHPDKEDTGGEDAHFICVDEQAIGVADGVGGWADLGVDAGQYARELMSNSVTAIQEEPKGLIDPARVLVKAHSSTKAKGSSTACIIALTERGIHAINLGDSGFIVVRDGCTVFRSPVQQHGFNFTYQLESGNDGDLPSSGEVFNVPVLAGDVIIAGTDGLFDNLYNNEVTAVVVHAVRAGLAPQVTAQKIAALARQRAQDSDRQTPFSTAAQDAGYRYYGGKLDDITVVVSYITSSSSV